MAEHGVSDPSRWFLDQLLTAVRHGQRLDDPRNAEVLARWVGIAVGLPDAALIPAIPEALRGLLRQPSLRGDLIRCGISPTLLAQHECIAPYVLSWRAYETARLNEGHSNGSPIMQAALTTLRHEIRQHLARHEAVFEAIAGLDQAVTPAISPAEASLQQRLLSAFVDGEPDHRDATPVRANSGHDVVSKNFRLYRLHLYRLKEERGETVDRRPSPRLVAAEIAVQNQIASLEALGQGPRAESEAHGLLGSQLAALYLTGIAWRAATPPAEPPLPDNVRPFRPRPS